GFFHVTQPLLLPMLRTRWGRILNVSSVAALIGNRGQVNYAAAKGALISATRALALEVATRGVTVNAIAPGIITTSMTEATFDDAAIGRLVPMRGAGSGSEVASLIDFLAADGAGYLTRPGESINGGRYCTARRSGGRRGRDRLPGIIAPMRADHRHPPPTRQPCSRLPLLAAM